MDLQPLIVFFSLSYVVYSSSDLHNGPDKLKSIGKYYAMDTKYLIQIFCIYHLVWNFKVRFENINHYIKQKIHQNSIVKCIMMTWTYKISSTSSGYYNR